MKRFNYLAIFLLAIVMTLSSCELIGDVIEFSVWLGIFIAAVVVGIIIWIVRKFRK